MSNPACCLILARDAANADLVLALANLRNPDPDWRGPLVSALASDGQYARAYATWARLSGVRGQSAVFNPGFAALAAPPPFNWAFADSPEGFAEPDGKGGIEILYYGRAPALLASQLLLLRPGRYRLAMSVSEAGEAKGALLWLLRCANTDKRLAELRLRAGPIAGTFAVPGGCEAQWLELHGIAGDMPRTAEAEIRDLRLAAEARPMSKAKEAILPAYLLLCLLIGGSAQGIWANALLQLLAIAILAWSALAKDPPPMPRTAGRLLLLVGLLLLLFVVQLVPLPPGLWTAIPGRQFLGAGFELLGMPLPWLPLSLAPYDTATTAMTLLPPLAVLVGMLRLRCWNIGWMFAAILAGAAASILLGVLQVTGGESWYYYQRTNIGVAVGAFANGNHFATLLLASMPVLAALATARWRSAKAKQERSLTGAMAIAGAAVLLIGLLINGSSAVLLLGLPVAAATAMLAMRLRPRRLRQGLAAIGLSLLIAAAALVTVGKSLPGWGTNASIETRMEFWSKTARATKDQLLTGSGIGTFQQAYRRYEDPGAVDRWYANHAHNDYLEIALEGGVPAILLLILFLTWWARQAREAWMAPVSTPEQKAAAVASAAILLHSSFDYPLRTAAIMGVMAVCLALLAGARGTKRSGNSDGREAARHATL